MVCCHKPSGIRTCLSWQFLLPAHHQHFVEQTSSLNLLWLIQKLLYVIDLLDTNPQDMIAGCSHIGITVDSFHMSQNPNVGDSEPKMEHETYNYV